MKPARTLVLRREALTEMSRGDLVAVAAGYSRPAGGGCDLVSDVVQCSLYCPATLRPFLCNQPTEGVCPTAVVDLSAVRTTC